MRRGWPVASAVVACAVAAVVLIVDDGGSSESSVAEVAASASTATAVVQRRDLVETDTADGTLDYADTRPVSGGLPGVVTWLPSIGRTVRSDGVLYEVDERPVVLLRGRVPAYRRLAAGVSAGTDVKQLERSLRAAGYDTARDLRVDRTWDAATTAAVVRWQRRHRLRRPGRSRLGGSCSFPTHGESAKFSRFSERRRLADRC